LGVVVSPLIALMKDQVDALRQAGVRAAALNSRLSSGETSEIERALRDGALDLLYVSPERLATKRCLELLSGCRLALFAVDEAHCISQWGHDFRPEYQQLSILRERFPGVPLAAVAFGMGIDKPDVRFIAHLDVPKNLEAYYQETGRAGLDGLAADAWMTYGFADVMNLIRLLDTGEIPEVQRLIEREKTEALI